MRVARLAGNRRTQPSFESLADYYFGDVDITDGPPERVSGYYVLANLFSFARRDPALGRTFSSSEDLFGKNHVVVLSDALWHKRFAAMPGVIGKTIHLNGEIYTVIGGMPPDFRFPNSSAQFMDALSFAPNDVMATRNNHFIDTIARLRPGVSVARARADVQSIALQMQRQIQRERLCAGRCIGLPKLGAGRYWSGAAHSAGGSRSGASDSVRKRRQSPSRESIRAAARVFRESGARRK